MVLLSNILVFFTIIPVGGLPNIQEHQTDMDLMGSFPYLVGAT